MLGSPTELETLVGVLAGLDVRAPSDAIVAVLRDAAHRLPGDLDGHVRFKPGRYTRNLIARNDAFELLALCWAAGSVSPIHDHGGSHGALLVISGTLFVDDFVVRDGPAGGVAQVDAAGSFTMRTGDVDVRSAQRDLHRVSARNGPAISLHFYAGPIERFTIFEPDGTCRTVAGRYDSVPRDFAPRDAQAVPS